MIWKEILFLNFWNNHFEFVTEQLFIWCVKMYSVYHKNFDFLNYWIHFDWIRCAGEIAAVPNTYCAVGVAYGAKVSGIKLFYNQLIIINNLMIMIFSLVNEIDILCFISYSNIDKWNNFYEWRETNIIYHLPIHN